MSRRYSSVTSIAVALILTAVGARPAPALEYQVEHGHGVSVAALHGDARVADDTQYTGFGPGADAPFQSGMTDSRGRATFLPNQPGSGTRTRSS
jgi:hypothetical protein